MTTQTFPTKKPVPRRKIRARETYSNFLRADDGRSFIEYIGFDMPRTEVRYYNGSCEYRMQSSRASGEWRPTKSAAKASYKTALTLERERRQTGQEYIRECV